MNRRWLSTHVLVAQLSLLAGGAAGADITPTDVFAEVFAVAHDVEQIRFYMGRPANRQEEIGVAEVAPREVI